MLDLVLNDKIYYPVDYCIIFRLPIFPEKNISKFSNQVERVKSVQVSYFRLSQKHTVVCVSSPET